MSTVLGKRPLTPENLLELPDDARFELVDGQLVRKEMSLLSAWVAAQITTRLTVAVKAQDLGVVLNSDASYRCYTDDPDRVRRPDVSFIHRSRIRPEYMEGHIPIPPDLAVEVVSPNDSFYEVRKKVGEYAQAAVRLVWVVNPAKREIDVHRANGTHRLLRNGDSLDGEDVVPGFICLLAEIFEPPPMDVKK